jgi:hypothetical protein
MNVQLAWDLNTRYNNMEKSVSWKAEHLVKKLTDLHWIQTLINVGTKYLILG